MVDLSESDGRKDGIRVKATGGESVAGEIPEEQTRPQTQAFRQRTTRRHSKTTRQKKRLIHTFKGLRPRVKRFLYCLTKNRMLEIPAMKRGVLSITIASATNTTNRS